MKKTNFGAGMISCLIAATSMINVANAQTDWHITGNAGTTSTSFLGTTDAKALTIKTNNAKRVTITSTGKVGIGTTTPTARLHVFGGTNASDTISVITALVKKTGNYDIAAVLGESQPAPGFGIGVEGLGNFLGVLANGGDHGALCQGFLADTLYATGETHGVTGITSLGHWAVGAFGAATTGAINYGVYGYSPDTSATSVDFAALFIGDIGFTGKAFDVSDAKFKQNITGLNNGLEMLSKLRPTTYQFRSKEFPILGLSNRKQYGFIAQEVESVYPELVKNSFIPPHYEGKVKVSEEIPFKSVDYISIIPMVVQAVQEQQQMINQKDAVISQQNDRISRLEDQLNALASLMEQSGQITPAQKNALVKTADNARLFQNQPNPANGSTTISFYIPSNVISAAINITNGQGSVLKSIPVNQRGNGQVIVNATDFATGSYNYSLVVDGKIADTKGMMMAK